MKKLFQQGLRVSLSHFQLFKLNVFLLLIVAATGCRSIPPHTVKPSAVQFLEYVPDNAYRIGIITWSFNKIVARNEIDLKKQIVSRGKDYLQSEAAENGANIVYIGQFQYSVNFFQGTTTYYLRIFWSPPLSSSD